MTKVYSSHDYTGDEIRDLEEWKEKSKTLLKKLLKALDIAQDRADLESGDTFGRYHNDAIDAIDAAEKLLKEKP